MSFWKRMNIKWDKDSISTWSSPRKTLYILFPLLVYFLVHDMAEVLLWAGLNLFMENSGETVAAFLRQNAYSVRGIIYGIAICLGVAAIGQGVLAEIDDKPKPFYEEGEQKEKKRRFLVPQSPQQVKKYSQERAGFAVLDLPFRVQKHWISKCLASYTFPFSWQTLIINSFYLISVASLRSSAHHLGHLPSTSWN